LADIRICRIYTLSKNNPVNLSMTLKYVLEVLTMAKIL